MKHRITRLVLLSVGTLLAITLGAADFLLTTYQPPPVDPNWALPPSQTIPTDALTVRYTGTATLVFSDGETTWMTDGWFSRPKPLQVLFGKIEPDLDAITNGLERNEVDELAAVFALHSHYDHAMDSPEVAKRTGAVLLGSESTANIGRGWRLPEKQIRVVVDREPIAIGKFTVTPIELRHFQFPDPEMAARALGDPEIDAPLTPPVAAFDYRVGKAYVLHVAHPKGTWLILGSAGFVAGALEGYDADVVFLGVGALGSQTDAYRESYWKETVERTNPTRVIPIHWDSLTGPAEGPFTGMVRAAALLSKGSENLLPFLQAKQAANPHINFITLPRYAPVVLF
ncbi:MAG: MBL fold metallo-hydrolase [Myxococcales bacterium]|nr:MAG: MBL fold metallo-hydrolase [Myxococcales bacterium]